MKTGDVKNMNVKERLDAMEQIWVSLRHEGVAVESPAWHEAVLQAREEKIAAGTAKFISIKELKSAYRAKN
ncbi:MAG TPA: addiction module protein [Candidatus Acidoferrum sp.]|nr:addiction module protein [Candidatus Acidoferrum sp.]